MPFGLINSVQKYNELIDRFDPKETLFAKFEEKHKVAELSMFERSQIKYDFNKVWYEYFQSLYYNAVVNTPTVYDKNTCHCTMEGIELPSYVSNYNKIPFSIRYTFKPIKNCILLYIIEIIKKIVNFLLFYLFIYIKSVFI